MSDKNDNTIFTLECPQCGIPFTTKNCNYGRKDILCAFGCRQHNKKVKSKKRSKKHYQKVDKKKIKKDINRARSLKKDDSKDKALKRKSVDPFFLYIRLLVQSILKINIQVQEITQIQEKLRSRCLSLYDKLCHFSRDG